jgi:hypothetical protein
MKRNWLPYIAVIAALVAGSIVSTAFAGPPSFKFGGGGGGNNNSGNGVSRSFQPRIGTLNGNGQSLGGNMQAQIKKFQGNGIGTIGGNGNGQSIGGMAPQIKKFPGIVGQVQGNGQNKPKFEVKPFVPGIVGGIGGNNGNNNGNGIPKLGKIDPGFNKNGNIGQAIGSAILGGGNGNGNGNSQNSIKCGPIKIGCKPWWSDCHHHDHCYKPCYPVCSHPIIVQVPVVVEQVAVVQPSMQVPVGSTLTLQSLGLGDVAGQVMLQVDRIAIPAMVNEWRPDAVTTTLPMLGLSGQVIADIVIVRADGTVANSIKVELINAQPQAAQAAAPAGAVQPAGFQADQGGAAAALGGL